MPREREYLLSPVLALAADWPPIRNSWCECDLDIFAAESLLEGLWFYIEEGLEYYDNKGKKHFTEWWCILDGYAHLGYFLYKECGLTDGIRR